MSQGRQRRHAAVGRQYRARGARPAVRLFTMLAVSVLALVIVLGRLVQLQVVEASSFESLGARQRVRKVELPARRGTIYDRNMQTLAVSVEARAVYANARFVDDPEATAAALAPLLDVDAAELAERLGRDSSFVYLRRGVDLPVADRVLALRLPGIGTLRETKRVYPAGSLAGQVLGFVGTDGLGLGGLEFAYERTLRGTPGAEILEQDPRGRPIPYGRSSIREPVAGRGLVLTIDRDIQFAVERALERAVRTTGAKQGVAVVTDPKSGDVLAMANHPPFDPNDVAAATGEASRNRAVTDVYEPGSVNKVITAAAAIEDGLMTPATRMKVPDTLRVADKTFGDFEPHPTETLTYGEVLARSSNIGTIKVALKLGAKRLDTMLRRFGLGEASGVRFPGEADGLLLPLASWYPTSIGTIPIGQGIAVTPLQVASVYATLANDGTWVRPRLVRGFVERDGTVTRVGRPDRRRVVGASTAAEVRSMMVGVVEQGTGRTARIPGYVIGGKTGTARKPKVGGRGYTRGLVTTFAAIVPADRPRVSALVSLDEPRIRFASLTAAPAVREIAQYLLAHFRIPPTFVGDGPLLPARRPVSP